MTPQKGEHEGHEGNRTGGGSRWVGGRRMASSECDDTAADMEARSRTNRGCPTAYRRRFCCLRDLRVRSWFYSVQRLKISDPFVPPNPKEFESAISTFALRDLFGT